MKVMEIKESRRRIIIEAIDPEVDGGRFPAKGIAGDTVFVEADIYADGHDALAARLLFRHEAEKAWTEAPMRHLVNDRWRGEFVTASKGLYFFTITAWIDGFRTWCLDLKKRTAAGREDLAINLLIGASLITGAGRRAQGTDRQKLTEYAGELKSGKVSLDKKVAIALGRGLRLLMEKYADRQYAATYPRELTVLAERERAVHGAWYEMFPRSTSPVPGQHGTFKDCEARLPYIAGMGFDVLYLPPIHPVGKTNRKGKNNAVTCRPGDPGTPWAIGSAEGGHKSLNPLLGTLTDFRHLVAEAEKYGIEIALDIAFQCSPDHPYVKEHPEWFLHRPDGSVQYAENPPKKYQDIYPLDFETENWRELWEELKSIVTYWAAQGVRIFRVDNPHTKPFQFWEWLIPGVKKDFPDTVFLSEAFTRPKVMYRLAKLGFTQSYTYFTWRNKKGEITDYLQELTRTPVKNFFRPNFWPNTPDILHEYLQTGGRAAFIVRLVLASMLSASYGIYGPAFELTDNTPREPGSEEYLNSEKYEIKHWDIERPDSLRDIIARINKIRRENPALHRNRNLWFNTTDSEHLICFSQHTDDLASIILTVVNLDPHNTRSGKVNVPLQSWGFDTEKPYQVYDLLNDKTYQWRGEWNYVELRPDTCPAHIFRLLDVVPRPVAAEGIDINDEKGR
jgi:starch synthase (maltosyl-transferring)